MNTITTILLSLIIATVSVKAYAQEKVVIPFNGNYGYTNDQPWPHREGWSRNFMNGAPEEHGIVQREGFLSGEIFWPTKERKAAPFMLWMHGCSGYKKEPQEMVRRYAALLANIGVGVLAVDSFTNRNVKDVCGYKKDKLQSQPNVYWSQRRVQDVYSALDFLISKGFADPAHVYLAGQSNGGSTVFTSMERTMQFHHKNKFALAFAQVPACTQHRYATFYAPVHMFIGSLDEKNRPQPWAEMNKVDRSNTPGLVMHWYEGAFHGYENPKGYTYEGIYRKHDPVATRDTQEQIKAAILKDLGRS